MSIPTFTYNGKPLPSLDEVTVATALQEASDELLIQELKRRGYKIIKDK